jgi:hypothetical protein
MEAGLRTPLLDFFRRGEVPRDVRLQAAQGTFAPRPVEQLGLLMVLTSDQDAEVRDTAEATLAGIPQDLLSGFVARSDVPTDLREFLVARGVSPAAAPAADPSQPLVDRDDADYGAEPTTEEEKLSMVQRLTKMSVPEKVRAAMKGSREMRSVLVRDPNKMVALAVLSSPKLTDAEVEAFCKMGSVTEDVLRVIGMSRAWTKNYGVIHSLVKNPKTPLAISLPMLNRINDGDVKRLASDRNIPEALRTAVRRRLSNV